MENIKLLDELTYDQNSINRNLYSSGPYWNHKNLRTAYEIKKKGILNFRGMTTGIGTSFVDNVLYDIRNEISYKFTGRIISRLLSLPMIKKFHNSQLKITEYHAKNALKNLSLLYKKDETVNMLIKKYKFENTTEFGCLRKFNINGIDYSYIYVEMGHRTDIISKNVDFTNIKSVFEIGGGFGANIHFLLTNFSNIKKIIYLDVVPNLYVGTEYLRHFYIQFCY